MLRIDPQDKKELIDPLFRTDRRFWMILGGLGILVAWGVIMYVRQLILGLTVTGLGRPAYWGIYMVNFIFLIGVSMAGTLVSAALFLTNANWRRPITRIAEAVTVFGLIIAAIQIVFDMGRPDRTLLLLIYGRLQSPLMWDVMSLSTYLMASMFALFISTLPDIAILRDNCPDDCPVWRRQMYRILALGWRGNREQWLRLERVMRTTAILIIPIGISLHTVTAWILATTVQPGWHSTIMGPYFVVGALFSGLGLLYVMLVAARKAFGLERYIGMAQFRNIQVLLIIMNITWFYFTYTEIMVEIAGQEEAAFPVLASKLWGADAPAFWGMVICMIIAAFALILPGLLPARLVARPAFKPRPILVNAGVATAAAALLWLPQARPLTVMLDTDMALGSLSGEVVLRIIFGVFLALAVITSLVWLKQHAVTATVIASVCIVLGMWLERWIILIPTLNHPHLILWSTYRPSFTEWSLMAASFALFGMIFLIFFKLIPVVSIWEVAEGRVIEEAESVVTIPMPEPTETRPGRRGFNWGR